VELVRLSSVCTADTGHGAWQAVLVRQLHNDLIGGGLALAFAQLVLSCWYAASHLPNPYPNQGVPAMTDCPSA
jgi:hypothetical protein